MSERERELARRHLDELIKLRDNAWKNVLAGGGTTRPMMKYEALCHAVKLAEGVLR